MPAVPGNTRKKSRGPRAGRCFPRAEGSAPRTADGSGVSLQPQRRSKNPRWCAHEGDSAASASVIVTAELIPTFVQDWIPVGCVRGSDCWASRRGVRMHAYRSAAPAVRASSDNSIIGRARWYHARFAVNQWECSNAKKKPSGRRASNGRGTRVVRGYFFAAARLNFVVNFSTRPAVSTRRFSPV
jgi:hypothetical protein